MDDEAVAAKLSEAAIFHRKKTPPTTTVKVGANPSHPTRRRRGGSGVAGLPTHAQGSSCHPAEEQEERDGRAPPACRADGTLVVQLQEGHDGLHPFSRHVRIEAVVEGRPYSRHRYQGKLATASIISRGASHVRLLPDHQPGGAVDGVRTQCSDSATKVLGQKFPYTQVQLPMMPSLNLLDPHNHNLESLSSWHTS